MLGEAPVISKKGRQAPPATGYPTHQQPASARPTTVVRCHRVCGFLKSPSSLMTAMGMSTSAGSAPRRTPYPPVDGCGRGQGFEAVV